MMIHETIRTLLVEDNPGDANLILEICSEAGVNQLQIECADSLRTAQQRLARGGIDVILLDLSLPDSQGLDTLNRMCSATKKVPIIVLTGLSDEETAIQAAQQGAQDYLVKGQFNSTLLFRSVSYAIERKRAELALRVSELKFRKLVDEMNDGYCVIQGYKIVFANSRAAQMFGYDLGSVLGKRIDELLPENPMRQLKQVYETGFRGGIVPPEHQITLPKKDGTTCQVELSSRVTVYEGKASISVVIRDVTERKLMEKTLSQKEQDYVVLLESTDDNIIVVDAETLKIVFGNRRAAKAFGFKSVPEALGSNLLYFIHPDDRDKVVKAFLEDPYAKERRQRYEVRAKTLDGREIWVSALATKIEFQGKVAVLLSLRDITERMEMEKELQQREEDYLSLLENTYDAIVVIDVETTKAVYGNRNAAKLFGFDYTKEEGIGLTPFDVIHPNDIEVAAKAFSNYYTYERPQLYEVRAYTKDRDVRWVQVLATRTNWQKKPAALLTLRDITERKSVEKALQQREQDYLTLLESGDEATIVVDAETLKVLFGNRRAARMFGTDPILHDGIGVDLLDFIHPDDRDSVVRAFLEDTYTQERRQRYEVRAKSRDDREMWITALATRIEFGGRVAVLLSIRDITEKKLAEDALRDSERRLSLYFENVSDVVYSIDPEFRVTSVSPSVEKLLGYKAEELIGKNVAEVNVVAPEYFDLAVSDIMRVMSGERIPHSEYQFITKDGRRRFGQVSGSPLFSPEGKVIGLVSVARDITDLKRAVDALRGSEARYRLLAENVKDIIWTRDMNLQTTYVSPSVTQMSGYSVEEVMSLSLEESMTPASLEVVRTALAKLRHDEEQGQSGLSNAVLLELELIHKNGSIVPVEMKVNLLRGEDGQPVGFLGVTRDIAERKKLEAQLQLASRLAAVGELAAGVAHELNNPLTGILGFAQLLSARKDLDEPLKKGLDTIYKEAQRSAKITKNLLSFARRHEPERRPLSINEVLEKTLELRAHEMTVNNIEVVSELQPDLPMIMADFHQVQQVFLNIVVNAEQAMVQAHGTGKFVVKTQEVGGIIRTTFTDDGPGIPEENLQRIFDPFFTTKEVGKGTGLGLSICYGIVQAHGGRIYATSKVGNGATFVVELPIVSEEQSAFQLALRNTIQDGKKWENREN